MVDGYFDNLHENNYKYKMLRILSEIVVNFLLFQFLKKKKRIQKYKIRH